MNKERLWKIYTDKNPSFLNGPINFSPEGLKKFFDQTFEQGVKEGQSIGTPSGSHNSGYIPPNADVPDFMKDLLSGKGFGK